MQKIIYAKDHKFIHPIFSEFNNLYTALSNNDDKKESLFDTEPCFDVNLRPFEYIFNEYGNCEKYLKYESKNYSKIQKIKTQKKSVIVAFSGGKDSTATALYYKDLGYKVYLYHVHGLNKLFPGEQESAESVAKHLGLPITIEDVHLSGKSLYPDHPLKNIIITNMALQWGIENNISTHISAGNYSTAYLDDNCFETAGDDCVEMWEAYIPIIKKYIPQFKFETPLVNIQDTFTRLSKDKNLLSLTRSCVMTHRYREYLRKQNIEKYNVKLLPHRCGSCWKCAYEYIWFTDNDVFDYNESYYQKCIKVLQENARRDTGIKLKDLRDVWHNYFFYDINKSKYFT